MPITLGTYTFDPAAVAVEEDYKEVGGRDGRVIRISGVLARLGGVDAIESALDEVLNAASADGAQTKLVLRSGRRLFVRRTAFRREISRTSLAAAFRLELEAGNAWEESEEEISAVWPIASMLSTMNFVTTGNLWSPPSIAFTAQRDVSKPSFSDGTRTVSFAGTMTSGQMLVFDCGAGRAFLEEDEVTGYTEGLFPRIAGPATVLTYLDDFNSTHQGEAVVTYRERWW